MATSGVAVLFSGVTVIVSLAGLWMIDNNAIRSMALGAILVVAVSLLASATLLPALIRAFGHRALRALRALHRRRACWPARARAGAPARPRPAAPPRRRLLGALDRARSCAGRSSPCSATSVAAARARDPGARPRRRARARCASSRTATRRASGFEAAAAVAGPARTVADARVVRGTAGEPADAPPSASLARARRATRRSRASTHRSPRATARSLLVAAVPRADGESAATKALVLRLREALPAAAGPGARVDVGGVTAAQQRRRAT